MIDDGKDIPSYHTFIVNNHESLYHVQCRTLNGNFIVYLIKLCSDIPVIHIHSNKSHFLMEAFLKCYTANICDNNYVTIVGFNFKMVTNYFNLSTKNVNIH